MIRPPYNLAALAWSLVASLVLAVLIFAVLFLALLGLWLWVTG